MWEYASTTFGGGGYEIDKNEGVSARCSPFDRLFTAGSLRLKSQLDHTRFTVIKGHDDAAAHAVREITHANREN